MPPSPKRTVVNFKGRAFEYKRVLYQLPELPEAELAIFSNPNTMGCLWWLLFSFPKRPKFTTPTTIPVTSPSTGFQSNWMGRLSPPTQRLAYSCCPSLAWSKCSINVCQIEFPSPWINRGRSKELAPSRVAPVPTSFMSHVLEGLAAATPLPLPLTSPASSACLWT